jgi:hypothetical protein
MGKSHFILFCSITLYLYMHKTLQPRSVVVLAVPLVFFLLLVFLFLLLEMG